MPIQSPPVIKPEDQNIAERIEKLVGLYFPPPPPPPPPQPSLGQSGLGRALVQIVGKMARHVVERINRVPDRSFLVFLDRIGVTPAGARAAEVPLTFSLVERGNEEPTVPAGTRVGATALPGDTREIVFETQRDLRTTRAKLVAAFVRQFKGDLFADHTPVATGAAEGAFEAFCTSDKALHAVYFGAEDVLGLPARTNVEVIINGTALKQLRIWEYWNGLTWRELIPPPDDTANIPFSIPQDMAQTVVNGRKARWIRARLAVWPTDNIVPTITDVTIQATEWQIDIAPEAIFSNGRPVDLSLSFYPFGEQPKLNNMMLIACDRVFACPEAEVRVEVAHHLDMKMTLNESDNPVVTWEISTGSGWQCLATVTPSGTTNDVLGTLDFTVPETAAPTTINNKKAVWVRARLSSGSFGKGVTVTYNGAGTPVTSDDGYRPPLVEPIKLQYKPVNNKPLCTSENERVMVDHTVDVSFAPFTRTEGSTADRTDDPTLCLGFDRKFAARDISLFFQVAPLDAENAMKEMSAGIRPAITWEYSSGTGTWTRLECEDETRGFALSGELRFVAPVDLAVRRVFGQDLIWLRAKYKLPTPKPTPEPASPRLGRVLTNTVWARNLITLKNEILGSSDGSKGQSYRLTALPVLEGQRIEVREVRAAQLAETISAEVDSRYPDECWVCWQEVPNFYASGPLDRHYGIDREAGTVLFGDGRRGMVPPQGVQNVRAASYTAGGGGEGNRPARFVEQLKTTVPYVDGVTNHEAATGGADADTFDEVKTWGPSTLRHGYRAVTTQDFEDLALEASPQVARAKAITPVFDMFGLADKPSAAIGNLDQGALVLLLVTNAAEMPPTAGTGLIREVDAYLRARSAPTLTLTLASPTWVKVNIKQLEVWSTSASGMETLRDQIERALTAFFHPLKGNVEGAGWAFGTLPRESDVYRLVMSIPGVDRIGVLDWEMLTPDKKDALKLNEVALSRALIYPGTQSVQVLPREGT